MKSPNDDEDHEILVPASATLDGWLAEKWENGVQINELHELEGFFFQTRNHTYEVTVINPATGEVIVTGGEFFSKPAVAMLIGACRGGSFIKRHGVYPGFNIEFLVDGTRILTTPVLRIVL